MKDFDEILKACEDLEYLNKFAGCLRESEYRILLILCGHTRHGKVPLSMVKPILDEYWHSYNYRAHLKNIAHILNVALRKIYNERIFKSFNANS
ncbi:MAG: hypothetical protein FGM16_09235 [Flavobacterium sp.]|nr:hypothetical protein [Flavobacterium sp.]